MDRPSTIAGAQDETTMASHIVRIILDHQATKDNCPYLVRGDHLLRLVHPFQGVRQE